LLTKKERSLWLQHKKGREVFCYSTKKERKPEIYAEFILFLSKWAHQGSFLPNHILYITTTSFRNIKSIVECLAFEDVILFSKTR